MQNPTNTLPALEPVRRLEARRAELVANVAAWKKDIEALSETIAQAIADGDPDGEDAEAARRRLRELRNLLHENEPAVKILDRRIRETYARISKAQLIDRLRTIKKVCGGLAGEDPRRRERIEALEVDLAEAKKKLEDARRTSELLRAEAEAIGDLLGIPLPEILSIPGAPRAVPPAFERRDPMSRLRELAGSLDAMGVETLSASLASFYPGVPTPKDWEAHLRDENARRIEFQAKERQEARDRIDAWLEALLRDTPVLKERVVEEAKAEGFSISRDPAQADLSNARARVGVVPLFRTEDPVREAWWGLDGHYDPERWKLHVSALEPASAVQG